MFKKFFSPQSLLSASVIIAVFSLTSRFLGLFRDRLLAGSFGAGDTLDMYYASFRLPDLIFNLLILGALNSAFIPIFKGLLAKNKNKSAWRLANNLTNIILIVMILLGVVFFVFANPITALIVPGFSPEKIATTAQLTRIMLLSPLFFGLSAITGGILNSFKRFASYSLAPVFYNLGIIAGILLLVPRFGIYGLAIGVVLGAILNLLIQIPETLLTGWRYKPYLNLKNRHVRQIVLLMLPTTAALAISQLMLTVDNIIASTLPSGSIVVFNLANNIQSLPIGIFSLTICTVVFPNLVEHLSSKDYHSFSNQLSKSARQILFVMIPAALFLYIYRAQVVRILFGTGAFSWEDTRLTLTTLGFFALSLPFQALLPLLVRAFYASKNTRQPLLASGIAMLINVILSLTLSRFFGVAGLALSFSIASIANLLICYFLLRRFLPQFKLDILPTTGRIILASVAAGLVSFIALRLFEPVFNNTTFLGLFGQTATSSIMGLGVYLGIAYVAKIEELHALTKIFRLPFKK